jgi:alkanesulfonate monooxygenase SsuD/methylene tetrahydromethanopterin reductase-like flavin-dependent oxidoreductase (luciferase family)
MLRDFDLSGARDQLESGGTVRFSIFSVTDHYPDQPRSIARFYDQLLDEIVLAEELGFEAFFIAEHHFHEYGIVPSPPALLGAAAARTSRIGLGVAVSVLPFHHPLVAAEEYALLDQLSGGRLRLGVGSGYLRHEFEGFQIDPSEKRERFEEALDILLRAWSGEPLSYDGRWHRVDGARIAVTPVQRPHPPLWIAILRPEAAWHVGRQGRDIMLIPYATSATIADLGRVIAEFARGRAESGTHGGDVAVAMHTYVAERPGQARPESEEALDRYVQTRLYAKRRSYDELEQAGLILFGDPEEVAGRIRQLEALGMTHLLILVNFGALPAERVRASMERFAKSVMPELTAPAGPA